MTKISKRPPSVINLRFGLKQNEVKRFDVPLDALELRLLFPNAPADVALGNLGNQFFLSFRNYKISELGVGIGDALADIATYWWSGADIRIDLKPWRGKAFYYSYNIISATYSMGIIVTTEGIWDD